MPRTKQAAKKSKVEDDDVDLSIEDSGDNEVEVSIEDDVAGSEFVSEDGGDESGDEGEENSEEEVEADADDEAEDDEADDSEDGDDEVEVKSKSKAKGKAAPKATKGVAKGKAPAKGAKAPLKGKAAPKAAKGKGKPEKDTTGQFEFCLLTDTIDPPLDGDATLNSKNIFTKTPMQAAKRFFTNICKTHKKNSGRSAVMSLFLLSKRLNLARSLAMWALASSWMNPRL